MGYVLALRNAMNVSLTMVGSPPRVFTNREGLSTSWMTANSPPGIVLFKWKSCSVITSKGCKDIPMEFR